VLWSGHVFLEPLDYCLDWLRLLGEFLGGCRVKWLGSFLFFLLLLERLQVSPARVEAVLHQLLDHARVLGHLGERNSGVPVLLFLLFPVAFLSFVDSDLSLGNRFLLGGHHLGSEMAHLHVLLVLEEVQFLRVFVLSGEHVGLTEKTRLLFGEERVHFGFFGGALVGVPSQIQHFALYLPL